MDILFMLSLITVILLGGCFYLPASNDIAIDIGAPLAPNSTPMIGFYSAFVDSQGTIHVYSSTNFTNGDQSLYYNALKGGIWQYPVNVPVIQFPGGINTTAMGSVIYDSSAPFNGYEYVMFFTNQPGDVAGFWALFGGSPPCIVEEPTSVGAGLVYVSFSHNPGSGWTTPCQFSIDGVHTVLTEQVSAIYYDGTIYITIFEGDFGIISANLNTITYAYMATALPSDPTRGTRINAGYYSLDGVTGFNPGITLTSPNTTDDNPFFVNLDTAFDPATGDFFVSRSYAYPFDVTAFTSGEVPCDVPSPKGMTTYPNRGQLLKMNLGNPPNVQLLFTGTWELVADYGAGIGYGTSTNGGTCTPTPLQDGQTDIGGQVNTMSILRTPEGFVDSSRQVMVAYGPHKASTPRLIKGSW